MPYVVLAAGALMTIAGFYAVVTGYGIVQLEQGWSAVISGSILIAGGVATMAMAAILHALQQVKAALAVAPRAASAQVVEAAKVPDAEAPTFPATPAPALTATDPEVAPVNVPVPVPATDPYESPSLTSALEPDPVPAPPPEPVASPVHVPPAPPPAPQPSDEFRPTPPTAIDSVPPITEPPHAAAAEPETPAMDDWLDRAFADLDEVRSIPPHREPAHPAPVEDFARHEPAPRDEPPPKDIVPNERAPREAAYAGMPASAPLTVVAQAAPDPAPAPQAAPTSAVIGRYEADGTSYTMYADGSIEAQSDAGVYRFASMAELKSFIET